MGQTKWRIEVREELFIKNKKVLTRDFSNAMLSRSQQWHRFHEATHTLNGYKK